MKNLEIEKGILYLSEKDPILASIIERKGKCTLKPHKNYYYSLLEAIIGQQLSVLAAASIINKFMDFFKGDPAPEMILASDDIVLRGLGLSGAKVKYVKDLSDKLLNKQVSLRALDKKSDEEIIAELTKVKGIGQWTAHMFLMFTLGRPDVLPTGDLGLKKAIMLNYELEELPSENTVLEISIRNNWQPYNTLASWYLWKSLENKP